MNVAVLGASDDPEKYSNHAVRLLAEKGHTVYPVNPKLSRIGELPVHPSLVALPAKPHTITLYVSAKVSDALAEEILGAGAERLIFNPGAENPALAARAAQRGIRVVEACTLVLLKTGQFERA